MSKRAQRGRKKEEKMPGVGFSEFADAAEQFVGEATADARRVIKPVSKCYPTLFMLLVTFGAVSTFYGFERLIQEVPYVGERPFLVLLIGIFTLVFTGTLYKKLS